MKPNHLHKLKENKSIGLSGKSIFNYILYSDVLENIKTDIVGTYELISKENTNISTIKKLFNSNTELGEYLYTTPTQFKNPIKIKRTSIETIKKYFI
jgi:5-formaminoimidazole-4-carboxamide-1-beta-D-ribofuranosyl 5'-monophosphate synthetase